MGIPILAVIDGALTFDDLKMIGGGAVALLGLWWRVETRVSSGARDALRETKKLADEFADYKLAVRDTYVKNEYLKDVETRVLERIDSIVEEVHGIRQAIQDAVVAGLANPKRRTRS